MLILNEAMLPTNGTLPLITVLPSLKVTVPPGIPGPKEAAFTIAVKVTDWPKNDGLLNDASNVEVGACTTGWLPKKSCMSLGSTP